MTGTRFPALAEDELAARYRRAYHAGPEIGAAEALAHWKLEHGLAERLRASTPENRWQEFAECYSTFYRHITWLDDHHARQNTARDFAQWSKLIFQRARVFEVGSGQAGLLRYLRDKGNTCVATEITPERGSKYLAESADLQWHTTDGIHLADFESECTYDFVLSNQVIEHFHPDDLITHFQHALRILKPGGQYILTTPHKGTGPHDLSKLFGLDEPACFHLREYNYTELFEMLTQSGFADIRAIFPPSRLFKLVGITWESRLYRSALCWYDNFEKSLRMSRGRQRKIRRILKYIGLADSIWLSASRAK